MDDLTRKNFLRLGAAAALAGTATSLGAGPAAAGGASGAGAGGAGAGSGSAGGGGAAAEFGSSADLDPGPGWGHVGHILSTIRPPQFPDRDFSITTFGAVPDATTLATDAIAKAIAACHNAGGGRVVVPAGTFLTGAIHLRSNVNLHVSAGATLLFSSDPEQYLPVVLTRFEGQELMNYSPFIYARDCENIALTGSGTLDGGGTWETWWSWTGPGGADAQTLQKMVADGVPVKDRVFGPGTICAPRSSRRSPAATC